MLVFAAYPVVAITSYLVGLQTNIGFRFLGRDLRLLLFIPIYLALRWAAPSRRLVGLAIGAGAFGAAAWTLLSRAGGKLPEGVAGTHIVFGDLAVLSGFVSLVLLLSTDQARVFRERSIAGALYGMVALLAGAVACFVAQARGAWAAVPLLTFVVIGMMPPALEMSKLKRIATAFGAVVLVACVGLSVPGIRQQVTGAFQRLHAYEVAVERRNATETCISSKPVLRALLAESYHSGFGSVHLLKLKRRDRMALKTHSCKGTFAIDISTPQARGPGLTLGLYRGRGIAQMERQKATIIARGVGDFNVGWKGQWVHIQSPDRWGKFMVSSTAKETRSLIISVKPGHSLVLIPFQERRGDVVDPLINSSIGRRLEMWRFSWRQFLARPVFGIGTGAFKAEIKRYGEQRLTGNYEHAHSDYLTSLATKGVFGFISMLLLMVVIPVAVFKICNESARECKFFRSSALVLASGFLVFGLTETMYVHSLVISWYVIASAAIVAASVRATCDVQRRGHVHKCDRLGTRR